MSCIERMIEEHENIKRMLVVIRRACNRILKHQKVHYEDFFRIIDFVRNYADKHHHVKEEAILFDRMTHDLGGTAEKLVRHGMMVEHDLGRLHIQELEDAVKRVLAGDEESRLDVIAHAIAYCHLLYRHIDKENKVVFPYAQKNLSAHSMQEVNRVCEDLEQMAREGGVQEKYLLMLAELEAVI